jgi:hypothetical protein
MLIAEFAKLVELVKKYAAPMYAPTAAGAAAPRWVRASEKITSSGPSVAIASASRCAPVARVAARCGRGRVLEQLEAGVVGGELLGGDP